MKQSYAVKRDEKKTRKQVQNKMFKWSKQDYKNETTEEEQADMKKEKNKLLAK